MYRQPLDADTELVFPLPNDAEELFAVVDRERERLGKWLPWLERVKSVEDERAFLRSSAGAIGQGRAYPYLIRVQGQPAGFVSLIIDLPGHTAKVGYWLGQDYEGRGIVTRGVAFLLDAGFDRLGLHRIEIRAAPGNRRSRAVPERLGFCYEGTARDAGQTSGGRCCDLEVWAMLASDWRGHRSARDEATRRLRGSSAPARARP